jgi:arylsulfatase A-like enzyme
MPELDTLSSIFASDGVRFTRAYASHPQCTPSRASLLSGMYTHNHGVLDNSPPLGGYPAFRRLESTTIAAMLQQAGYRTAHIGKYMNAYPNGVPDPIPPGWDRWYGHVTTFEGGRYYDYWVMDEGEQFFRGSEPEDYETDVLAEEATEFLEGLEEGDAFFLYMGVQAPHLDPIASAERHAGYFLSSEAPRLPSFNELDVSDKPAFVQNVDLLTQRQIARLDDLQRGRLRSMLAVEDLIRRLLATLEATGRAERTFVIFTSDNGICMGAHRLFARKRNFYEESVAVPLMVRGPGVQRGAVVEALVELVDIPATIADLAGLEQPAAFDGRPLTRLLAEGTAPEDWRQDVLLEFHTTQMSYALRTREYLYTELNSVERELYDMRTDPYQLQNLIRTADPDLIAALSARLAVRKTCRGAGCRD